MHHIPTSLPVVIFCGGKGTRLKEETEFKPKPMVTIGGMPILWHIMKTYAAQGFSRFVLCLGYKSEMVKDFFVHRRFRESDCRITLNDGTVTHLNSRGEDWDVTFVETGLETLTGERLLRAASYIDTEQFMVTYGDGVAKLDVRELIAFHAEQRTIGTITGVHPYSKWGLVETDSANRVTTFRQKPQLREYVNGGYMVFQRSMLDHVKPGTMIEETLAELATDRQLSLFRHEGFWHAMDTYQDMEHLNALWEQEAPWKVWSDEMPWQARQRVRV